MAMTKNWGIWKNRKEVSLVWSIVGKGSRQKESTLQLDLPKSSWILGYRLPLKSAAANGY